MRLRVSIGCRSHHRLSSVHVCLRLTGVGWMSVCVLRCLMRLVRVSVRLWWRPAHSHLRWPTRPLPGNVHRRGSRRRDRRVWRVRGLWRSSTTVRGSIVRRWIRLLSRARTASTTFIGPIRLVEFAILVLLTARSNGQTTTHVRLGGSCHWLRTRGT